jgi:hypothetical protein
MKTHEADNPQLKKLRLEDRRYFKNVIRVTPTNFEDGLIKVCPIIPRKYAFIRQAIPENDKLVVTFRYLSITDSLKKLMYMVRIPTTSNSRLIPEVRDAIITSLRQYVKLSFFKMSLYT